MGDFGFGEDLHAIFVGIGQIGQIDGVFGSDITARTAITTPKVQPGLIDACRIGLVLAKLMTTGLLTISPSGGLRAFFQRFIFDVAVGLVDPAIGRSMWVARANPSSSSSPCKISSGHCGFLKHTRIGAQGDSGVHQRTTAKPSAG